MEKRRVRWYSINRLTRLTQLFVQPQTAYKLCSYLALLKRNFHLLASDYAPFFSPCDGRTEPSYPASAGQNTRIGGSNEVLLPIWAFPRNHLLRRTKRAAMMTVRQISALPPTGAHPAHPAGGTHVWPQADCLPDKTPVATPNVGQASRRFTLCRVTPPAPAPRWHSVSAPCLENPHVD